MDLVKLSLKHKIKDLLYCPITGRQITNEELETNEYKEYKIDDLVSSKQNRVNKYTYKFFYIIFYIIFYIKSFSIILTQ